MPDKEEKLPLSVTHPELAKQANGWDPSSVTAGSRRKALWKCSLGHTWTTAVARRSKGTNCPYCSGNKVLAGFNDLATTHPELAKEADGWDPTRISKGMHTKLKWKCLKGHTWETTVVQRTKKESPSGCPTCSNRIILPGFNDLSTLFPELVASVNGWDPTKVGAGSRKKLEWKCNLGHQWTSSVTQRTNGGYQGNGTGCPYCAGTKVLKGFNDLLTTHPAIAAEADGWDPTEVSAGSSKLKRWKCGNQHNWNSLVVSRTRNRSTSCPYCTNQKLLKGFNDLLTTHPAIAAEADGWDPSTVMRGMDKARQWKCALGHKWKTDVIVRTRGSGCPTCAPTGYDPNSTSYLYFLEHPNWEMLQIGITNDIDTRMYAHGLLGWHCVEYRGPMDAQVCREWETAILRMLKAKGADLSNESIAGKFDGYSEAWSKSTFEMKSIKELMRLTEEFEESKDFASAKSPQPKKSL